MIDGLLSGAPDRNERLSPVVQEVSQAYDYILIDTPPTFGALTANALTAADEIIIPTGADSTAMAGIVEVINQAKQAGLDVAGVLITCFRANTKLQRECESAIRGIMAELGVRVYNAKIRQSVVVQTAQRNRAALFDFDESAPVAQDYEQFIDEYLNPVQE
jgi:chromosome partitioning protein